MKRTLYMLSLLMLFCVGGLLTGCSNEDIEISSISQMSVRVSTQGLYDQFNATQAIKERFLAKDYKVGVNVFVYNSTGVLVAEAKETSNVFGSMNMTIPNMKGGKYTLMAVETLVNVEEGEESEDWEIVGKERLSTVEVAGKLEFHFWYSVVGVAVREIEISGKEDTTFDLYPKGIGTEISCDCYNFDKSPFSLMLLSIKDKAKGRYLSPYYQGKDRFHYESYNEERTWTGISYSFMKEDNYYSGFDAYTIEDGAMTMTFAPHKVDSNGEIDWSFYPMSKNVTLTDGTIMYGACVYVSGDGASSCTSDFFATQTLADNWVKQQPGYPFDSTPSTPTTSFFAPYLSWGASGSSVVNYMASKGVSTYKRNTDGEDVWYDFWLPDNSVLYEYLFDTNDLNLWCVAVGFSRTKYTLAQVKNLMATGYSGGSYDTDLEGYFYYNSSNIMLIEDDSNEDLIVCTLIKNTSSESKRDMKSVNSKGKNIRPRIIGEGTPKFFRMNGNLFYKDSSDLKTIKAAR